MREYASIALRPCSLRAASCWCTRSGLRADRLRPARRPTRGPRRGARLRERTPQATGGRQPKLRAAYILMA